MPRSFLASCSHLVPGIDRRPPAGVSLCYTGGAQLSAGPLGGQRMTTELTLLALCVGLGFVHIVAASHSASLQRGYRWSASARDEPMEPLHGVAGRLDRALKNYLETFPLFAAVVLAAHVAGRHNALAEWGARLYFWEGLMAGRIGRGEIWQFDEFSSETSLRLNGRPLYLDRFRLMPKEDPPNTEWMMGNARYLATGLCFDERASDFAERIHLLLPDTAVGIDTPRLENRMSRFLCEDCY